MTGGNSHHQTHVTGNSPTCPELDSNPYAVVRDSEQTMLWKALGRLKVKTLSKHIS